MRRRWRGAAGPAARGARAVPATLVVGLSLLAWAAADGRPGPDAIPTARSVSTVCETPNAALIPEAGSTEFYRIELVPTGAIPGTAAVRGSVAVTFQDSPFDVALSGEGSFHRHLEVDLATLRPPRRGGYVIWVTPPELEPVVKLGVLDEHMRLIGEAAFPKFLVVVTLEEDPRATSGAWRGPVVFRGISRSGYMHTMAGHGPFQQEPCAAYGF